MVFCIWDVGDGAAACIFIVCVYVCLCVRTCLVQIWVRYLGESVTSRVCMCAHACACVRYIHGSPRAYSYVNAQHIKMNSIYTCIHNTYKWSVFIRAYTTHINVRKLSWGARCVFMRVYVLARICIHTCIYNAYTCLWPAGVCACMSIRRHMYTHMRTHATHTCGRRLFLEDIGTEHPDHQHRRNPVPKRMHIGFYVFKYMRVYEYASARQHPRIPLPKRMEVWVCIYVRRSVCMYVSVRQHLRILVSVQLYVSVRDFLYVYMDMRGYEYMSDHHHLHIKCRHMNVRTRQHKHMITYHNTVYKSRTWPIHTHI